MNFYLISLNDCFEKNGPLKIIKNSHTKKLYSHHSNDNYFVGKINTKKNKINFKKSVSLIGMVRRPRGRPFSGEVTWQSANWQSVAM